MDIRPSKTLHNNDTHRNGLVQDILEKQGMNIKQLAVMASWSYQNLVGFLQFRFLASGENKKDLYRALKKLDRRVTYDAVFPSNFPEIQRIFNPRVQRKKIDPERILLHINTLEVVDNGDGTLELVDNGTEDRILDKIDYTRIVKAIDRSNLTGVQRKVLKLSQGVGCQALSTAEIADELSISRAFVDIVMKKATSALRRDIQREIWSTRSRSFAAKLITEEDKILETLPPPKPIVVRDIRPLILSKMEQATLRERARASRLGVGVPSRRASKGSIAIFRKTVDDALRAKKQRIMIREVGHKGNPGDGLRIKWDTAQSELVKAQHRVWEVEHDILVALGLPPEHHDISDEWPCEKSPVGCCVLSKGLCVYCDKERI